jgi:hypothetical protein
MLAVFYSNLFQQLFSEAVLPQAQISHRTCFLALQSLAEVDTTAGEAKCA